jgi:hypothetical protein
MATRKRKATKENIQARAEAIMAEAGVGFVKALIRARKEFGLVSPNAGKERAPKVATA